MSSNTDGIQTGEGPAAESKSFRSPYAPHHRSNFFPYSDWDWGGPKGLGDPESRRVSHIENDKLVNRIIKERTLNEKCLDLEKNYLRCIRREGDMLRFLWRCKEEKRIYQSCQHYWYTNDEFKNECREEFLRERSEYRRTGWPKKVREYVKAKREEEEAEEKRIEEERKRQEDAAKWWWQKLF